MRWNHVKDWNNNGVQWSNNQNEHEVGLNCSHEQNEWNESGEMNPNERNWISEIQIFEFKNWAKSWQKKPDARAQLKNIPTARGFYRIPSQVKACVCFHFENVPPNCSNKEKS